MKSPEEVKLSREEGEALIERVKVSNLAADAQGLVVKLIQIYFWLTLALQETKISLKRLKVALFGEGRKKRGLPGGGSGGDRGRCRSKPSPDRATPEAIGGQAKR